MTRRPIVACLLVAGCAAAPGGAREATYLCGGGRLAAVTFAGETARLRLANEQFELRREPAASGARYAGPRGTLHARDDEALLTVDGRQLGPCQEVKPKS